MKLPSGKHAYEILILLIVILFAVYTHAEEPATITESTSTESSETATVSTSTEDMQENKVMLENVRTEHRAQLERRFQDRIFNLTRNITSRLGASIERFENISNRLDTRIAKLKNTGTDTAAAETKLAEAKTSLREAKENLETLPSVQQALTSDTPRESFNKIRTNILSIRDAVRHTHEQLTEVVTLLKNAPIQQVAEETMTENATTTKPTE